EGVLYHHVGLYAYRRQALETFVKLPPSALERRERLEQLRALEGGMRIDVTLVEEAFCGIDTPEAVEVEMNRSKIAYQGERGAYSHVACRDVFPDWEPLPCPTFEDALASVSD